MIMRYTLGQFHSKPAARCLCFSLTFAPPMLSLLGRRRDGALPAALLGDCATALLPENGSRPADGIGDERLRASVVFIAGELAANALKFHDPNSPAPITIRLEADDRRVYICTRNSVEAAQRRRYMDFICQLLQGNVSGRPSAAAGPDEPGEHPDTRRRGLRTIARDYPACLGWLFEGRRSGSGCMTVTTQVCLPSGACRR